MRKTQAPEPVCDTLTGYYITPVKFHDGAGRLCYAIKTPAGLFHTEKSAGRVLITAAKMWTQTRACIRLGGLPIPYETPDFYSITQAAAYMKKNAADLV